MICVATLKAQAGMASLIGLDSRLTILLLSKTTRREPRKVNKHFKNKPFYAQDSSPNLLRFYEGFLRFSISFFDRLSIISFVLLII